MPVWGWALIFAGVVGAAVAIGLIFYGKQKQGKPQKKKRALEPAPAPPAPQPALEPTPTVAEPLPMYQPVQQPVYSYTQPVTTYAAPAPVTTYAAPAPMATVQVAPTISTVQMPTTAVSTYASATMPAVVQPQHVYMQPQQQQAYYGEQPAGMVYPTFGGSQGMPTGPAFP